MSIKVLLEDDGTVRLTLADGTALTPAQVKSVRAQQAEQIAETLERACERWNQGIDELRKRLLPKVTLRRFTASGLAKVVARTARIVGVDVSSHSLRHACATHLQQGGADARQIQRLLGHKCLATTALYTRVDLGQLTKMIRKCHPREMRRARPRLAVQWE